MENDGDFATGFDCSFDIMHMLSLLVAWPRWS